MSKSRYSRAVAAAFLTLFGSTIAYAESSYCTPKADGTDRIAKTGSSCPSDYFSSGNCCEAFDRDTPKAFPKYKGASCPYGTFTSGHYCERFR